MATVRDHYASHLAPIYLWMAGGFDNALALGKSDLKALGIEARTGMVALDLGAGFGMHAIPLARAGCAVTTLDSSATLLNELRAHADRLPIRVIEGDLLNAASYGTKAPQLLLCMGNTLTYLQTEQEVEDLFAQVARILAPGGLLRRGLP
jgi:SAM-dependent methyltransferase